MREGSVDDLVQIVMPGGTLEIRRRDDGALFQRGPADRVYRATVDLDVASGH